MCDDGFAIGNGPTLNPKGNDMDAIVKPAKKLNWKVLNVDSLPSDIQEAYKAYKEAYKLAMEFRDGFETIMRAAVADDTPKGKRLAIAYNFGKLSVAWDDDDGKAKAKPSKAISLADLVKR